MTTAMATGAILPVAIEAAGRPSRNALLWTAITLGGGVDEPRSGSAALLHFEEGKLSAGEVLSALAPVTRGERTFGYLRVADGRF